MFAEKGSWLDNLYLGPVRSWTFNLYTIEKYRLIIEALKANWQTNCSLSLWEDVQFSYSAQMSAGLAVGPVALHLFSAQGRFLKVNTKRVLVTGHHGYIGSVLTRVLTNAGYQVVGLDSDFFSENRFVGEVTDVPAISGDLRDVNARDLEGFYAVLHLAALRCTWPNSQSKPE